MFAGYGQHVTASEFSAQTYNMPKQEQTNPPLQNVDGLLAIN